MNIFQFFLRGGGWVEGGQKVFRSFMALWFYQYILIFYSYIKISKLL
jgi:hypothetical protein